MIVTVSDFEQITGISRNTVYSWIYRDKFPQGIKQHHTLGSSKMLEISPESDYFKRVEKRFLKVQGT
jgi:hypothetical protein